MFRTSFNRGDKRYTSNPGRGVRDKMSPVVDKEGVRYLEKVGETDQYSFIQSFKDSCDIKMMVEKYALTGDISFLQRVQGVFNDVVGMPTDLRGLEDIRLYAENQYDALSDEIKAKLTFEDFLGGFADQESFDALQRIFAPSTTESEVVTNESQQ